MSLAVNPAPLCLIDSSIYIFKYYFSLPDNWFSQEQGWPTAAVYGFTSFLCGLKEKHRPERAAACFDESLGSGFREELYPGYKSSRALPDEALEFQLNNCKKMAGLLGLACFASQRYEADDLIGCLFQQAKSSSQPVAILSRDKDLAQLIRRPQDFLWDYGQDQRSYEADIEAKWGVRAEQLADYLALVGDSIDDIPGVPGVGGKTASALLQEFANIDTLYRNLPQCQQLDIRGSKTLAKKLQPYLEQVKMAKQLATIVTEVKLVASINELNWREPDWPEVELLCQSLGFPRLYKRIQTAFKG